ncbi:MAG: arylsulfatase [Verrucomicrobiota bacterium]
MFSKILRFLHCLPIATLLPTSLMAEKPNIVIFMADDLGYGSLNSYGAPENFVKTPRLDGLAEQGILFKNAFATASVCTPTRYTMLTGQYSWRTRLKKSVVNTMDPLLIDPETKTIGSFLQDKGYRTAAIGKWHLGYKEKKFKNLLGKIEPGPLQVGFDYHFGVPNNLDDFHKVYIENDGIYGLKSDKMQVYGTSYYKAKDAYAGYDAPQRVTDEVMDTTMDKAIEWINKEKEKPFFLYFGAVAVHHPIIPSKYMKGKSGAGLYGDFIQDTDRVTGRLIDYLKEKGALENTLFIFTSDNGGDIPNNDEKHEKITFDMGFKFNGDIRADKHTIFDGGLRVPFIVSWPAKLGKGLVSNELVTTGDLFATIAEVVDGKVPDPAVAAPDSFSFWNILQDTTQKSDRPHLINRDVLGRHALRFGKWKYIEGIPAAGTSEVKKGKMLEQLYNIEEDPAEEENVFKNHPEVAQQAKKLLLEIRNNPSSRNVPGV